VYGAQHQQVQQAHTAAALHHGNTVRRNIGVTHAAQHAGRRFHEHRHIIGQIIGQLAGRMGSGAGFDHHMIGKSPRRQKVLLECFAHGDGTAPAQRALSARHMMGNRDPVAVAKSADAVANARHLTYQLVPQHRTRRYRAGVQLEQIGSAQPDDAHLEQQLAGLRGQQRSFLHRRAIAAAAGDNHVAPWNGHDC
jgi:hypothetical protein